MAITRPTLFRAQPTAGKRGLLAPIRRQCSSPKLVLYTSALADDFDDNSKDATKWGADAPWRVPGDSTTGVTVSEVNGRTEIVGPSATAGNSFNGRVSADLFSLTDSDIVIGIGSSTGTMVDSAEDIYLSFGLDQNNHYFVILRNSGGAIQVLLGYVLASSITVVSTVSTGTSTLPSWLRLSHRISLNQLLVDTATSGAANPPISTDWTNRGTMAPQAGIPTSSGYQSFGAGTWASTAPTTFYFDGFNTATTSSTAAASYSDAAYFGTGAPIYSGNTATITATHTGGTNNVACIFAHSDGGATVTGVTLDGAAATVIVVTSASNPSGIVAYAPVSSSGTHTWVITFSVTAPTTQGTVVTMTGVTATPSQTAVQSWGSYTPESTGSISVSASGIAITFLGTASTGGTWSNATEIATTSVNFPLAYSTASGTVNYNVTGSGSQMASLSWAAANAGSASAVGLSLETDSSFALGLATPVGLASGTNTAFALAATFVSATGLATETDSSFSLGSARPFGLSSETDSSLALARVSPRLVGLGSETDSSLALASKALGAVAVSSETDSAQALARIANKALGVGTETDSSLALVAKQLKVVGISSETDTALPLFQGGSAGSVGTAAETDSSRALGMVNGFAPSLESDAALALGRSLPTGRANETDTAIAAALVVARAVGRANESEAALALTIVQVRPSGFAAENDNSLTLGVSVSVGRAEELDEAIELPPAAPADIPESRTTHAPASTSQSQASTNMNTTYAPKRAA